MSLNVEGWVRDDSKGESENEQVNVEDEVGLENMGERNYSRD